MLTDIVCEECGKRQTVGDNNPIADSDVVVCAGCGRDLGTYGVLTAGIADAASSEIGRILALSIKDPEWK